MWPEHDSNLGLNMSQRMNYEAATLTTRPPRPDKLCIKLSLCEYTLFFVADGLCQNTKLFNLKIPWMGELSSRDYATIEKLLIICKY